MRLWVIGRRGRLIISLLPSFGSKGYEFGHLSRLRGTSQKTQAGVKWLNDDLSLAMFRDMKPGTVFEEIGSGKGSRTGICTGGI